MHLFTFNVEKMVDIKESSNYGIEIISISILVNHQ